MQIIYAFIYYFTIFMTILVLLLSVFLLKPARTLLYNIWKKHRQILSNDIFRIAFMLSFTIMGFVLLQSVYNYFILNAHFSRRSERLISKLGGLDNIDLVIPESKNREGYDLALKEYREYYLAQRNIMLVLSAAFTFFVFQRLFYNIRKYSEIEHQIQEEHLVLSASGELQAEKMKNQ